MDLDAEIRIGKKRALSFLSYRALLSSDLAKKLRAEGLSETAIEAVLTFCAEAGYINDAEQVSHLITKELKKGKSPKWIYLKLKQKGVDASLMQSLCHASASTEQEALENYLRKQGNGLRRAGPDAWKKNVNKLGRLGFSYDTIVAALKNLEPLP